MNNRAEIFCVYQGGKSEEIYIEYNRLVKGADFYEFVEARMKKNEKTGYKPFDRICLSINSVKRLAISTINEGSEEEQG